MNKNVVYSVITNNYDEVLPTPDTREGWDYILFTDSKINTTYSWRIINIDDALRNPIKTQRSLKIFNNYIFENYKNSIYIDGNIQMLEKPEHLWSLFGSEFTLMSHPFHSTLRAEQKLITDAKKDCPQKIKKQIDQYFLDGYKDIYGMVQTGIMFRQHTERVIEVCKFWLEEVIKNSHRDQLSFNYSCWKKNFNYNLIPIHSQKLYHDTNLFKKVKCH